MGKMMHNGSLVSLVKKGVITPSLITKNITQNGTYNAEDDNADGYSSVVVNVSGGTTRLTKLIDWALYSHPSAFDSISLPANYTDYTHLLIVCRQTTGIPDWIEPMLEPAFKYYLDNNSIPDNVFMLIDTSTITASDQYIYVPFLNGAAFTFGTWGTTLINSSRILGTNYNWGWQNIYLACYGVNIPS